MIYQADSSKAEEFIHHEEILDTLEYAQNNKDNRALIEQLIEKAALCKGLTHREAAGISAVQCVVDSANQLVQREIIHRLVFPVVGNFG